MNILINNRDSKTLIEDILELKKTNSSIINNNIVIDNTINNKSLELLFNEYEKINHSINKITNIFYKDITKNITDITCINDSKLIDHFNSKYIHYEIKDYIFNTKGKQIKYTLPGNIDYVIYFILFIDNIDDTYIEYLDMCAINIFSIINYLENYRHVNCNSKQLEIFIFFTDFKKEIPTNKLEIIGSKNVNSGLTIPCQDNSKIVIYRKEEFIKLTIHELIHALGIHIPDSLYKLYTTKLDNIFNIDSTYNINETYTEIWALIINSLLFIANSNDILDSKMSKYKQNICKYINDCINLEILYSNIQVIKILNFMNLDITDLNNKSVNNKFKEDTHVFGYYIMKYLLLFNINSFLEICDKNSKQLIIFSDNNNNNIDALKDKIIKLIKLITNVYNNKKFISNYKKIQNIIFNNNYKFKNALILKSMRMTCIELA